MTRLVGLPVVGIIRLLKFGLWHGRKRWSAMDGARFDVSDQRNEEAFRFLEDRIFDCNVAATNIHDGRHLVINVRLGSEIIAGLDGSTWGGVLEIKYLWVREDMRKRGYGKRLLATAERVAVLRDCFQSVLDTYSFQAPEFYLKLGYSVYGVMHDCPQGHTKFHLRKGLRRLSEMPEKADSRHGPTNNGL